MENGSKIKFKSLTCDLVFIMMGFISLYIYIRNEFPNANVNNCMWESAKQAVGNAAMIVVIYIFQIKIKEDKHIYENKKAIIPFFIAEGILLATIFCLNSLFKLNNTNLGKVNIKVALLLPLGLTSTLLIGYFFKVKLSEFNWKISIKSLILVIIAYTSYILILNLHEIYTGTIHISSILNAKFLLGFIKCSFYPGFYEEVLYRGFLISGLKGFGLSDNKSNIIQAIIFGIGHVMSWGTASWLFLLSTAVQAMGGYVLGRLYFKTKSLLPCILLHGLFDAI